MNTRFFSPFIGSRYRNGVCGKRILVLGASFYCNHTPDSNKPCPFFEECTDPMKKDSSKFDNIWMSQGQVNDIMTDAQFLGFKNDRGVIPLCYDFPCKFIKIK